MNNALILARVSTGEQLKGQSINTQLAANREYAARQDLNVVAEIVHDESGAVLERDGLDEVRARVRRGEAQHVIVYCLDRLTREPADLFIVRKELRQQGVTIHYAMRGRASTSLDDDFFDDMEAAFAKRERAMIRERSMRGVRAKVQSGKMVGNGPAPYGYTWEGHRRERTLIVNEEEAAIRRQICAWYVQREPLSVVKIAARLTEQHVPTRADLTGHSSKQRDYAQWDVSTIYRILQHSAHDGIFYAQRYKKVNGKAQLRPRAEWVPIAIPPLLDPTIAAAIKRKLANGRQLASRNNTQRFYLLRCRIKCACGYAWHGAPPRRATKPEAYCYCCNSYHLGRPRCNTPRVPGPLFETRVWDWLCTEVFNPAALARRIALKRESSTTDLIQLHQERDHLVAALNANADASQRLIDLYVHGGFELAALDRRKAALNLERDRLMTSLAELEARITQTDLSDAATESLLLFAAIIAEGLEGMSPEERRRVIDLADTRLIVRVEDGTIVADATCVLRPEAAPLLIDYATRSSSPTWAAGSASPTTRSSARSTWSMCRRGCARRTPR